MGKNLLDRYQKGMLDDIYDENVEAEQEAIITRQNKFLGRQDSKRTKSSYISANKKAAKKVVAVNTEEIESLSKDLCRKRTY